MAGVCARAGADYSVSSVPKAQEHGDVSLAAFHVQGSNRSSGRGCTSGSRPSDCSQSDPGRQLGASGAEFSCTENRATQSQQHFRALFKQSGVKGAVSMRC